MNNIIWLTLGMMAATYLARVSGYWFILFFKPNEQTQAFLRLVPGTLFIAMIAPQIVNSGWIGWIAVIVVFICAAKSRNMLLALTLGMILFVVLKSITLAV